MICWWHRWLGHRSWWVAYWLAYVGLGWLLLWHHELSADAGVTLTGAWLVSQGKLLYRDFAADYFPPGSFYLIGAAFKLFGAEYWVAHLTALSFLLLSGYGLVRASRSFLPEWGRALTPWLWLVFLSFYPLVNHNPLSLGMAVWAWVAVQAALQRGRARDFALAGILSGLVLWFLQHKGLATILAAGVVIFWVSRLRARRLGWYLLGVLLSLLPAFAVWPPSVLWTALVAFPLRYYLPANWVNPWLLLVVGGLYGLVWLRLGRDRAPPEAVGLWWWGLWLLLSSASRPDPYHVILNSFPLIPLALWCLHSALTRPRARFWDGVNRSLVAIPLVAYVVALVVSFVIVNVAGFWLRPTLSWRQWLRLQRPELDLVVQQIQARVPPAGQIYAGPFLPNLYFESRRNPATRFTSLVTGLYPPAAFQAARRELEANPPALVVLNYAMVEKFRHRRDNPVDEYFRHRYHLVQRLGDVLFLEPNAVEDLGVPVLW